MTKLFLLFGTPGAGKTTVLSGVKGVKAITVGTEMLKAYSKKFGITDRDMIRKRAVLNNKVDAQIRSAVLRTAAKKPGTVVLDTHASLKTHDSYYPGLSLADFDILKSAAKAIIYVDASDREIMERRALDKTRKREDTGNVEWEIDQHRNINFALIAIFSLRLGVPLFVVMNRNNQLRQAQKRIQEIIKSIK
jgi:adenylate kinase